MKAISHLAKTTFTEKKANQLTQLTKRDEIYLIRKIKFSVAFKRDTSES